jgi:hypothetical protein
MEALMQAKKSNPKGRWWIKGDACDVRKGLRESMRGEWAGDEDLGSGALQKLFEEYKSRCAMVRGLGSIARGHFLLDDLTKLQEMVMSDLIFQTEGKQAAKKVYEKALQASRFSEPLLMELAWHVTGFEELLKQAKQFQDELDMMIQCCKSDRHDKARIYCQISEQMF